MRLRSALIFSLALALPFSGCGKLKERFAAQSKGDDDDSAIDPEEEARIVPVRVLPMERQDLEEAVVASSTVESERAADVFVEVAGTVTSLSVEEGDRVQPGTTLAHLRASALDAQAKAAKEEAEQAERDLQSVTKVYDGGFLSEQEFQAARLRLEQARSSLAAAEDNRRKTNLASPIRGAVVERMLRFGEAVSPGQPAFRIMDLDELKVIVRLPERDLVRLQVGQTALVVSELQGDVEVEGTVERIAPVVDPASGTVKVTVALPTGERSLRPGSFVQVRIVTATRDQVPVVPKKALTLRQGKKHLYVVRGDKAVELVPELGLDGGEVFEVLSNGPEADDLIVVVGQESLDDGTQVRIVEADPETKVEAETEGKSADAEDQP
jgi:membrane fusion protein (multidrug efflux system)